MQSINLQLNIKTVLGTLFFMGIFIAIFAKGYIFSQIIGTGSDAEIQASRKASKDIADLLLSLDKISFDTKVLNSGYLQNLLVLPSFPIDARTLSNFGKANPFLGGFTVVTNTASSSVGGLIYSNQRSSSTAPITSVNSSRR
jgi:hypothetical protein